MQQNTFLVCFIISLIIVYLNVQKRKSSSFTTAQRKFQDQMLKAHNAYRLRHCAPPLKLNDDLNRSAQKYAEHLASTNIFEHSNDEELGENLFKMTSTREIDDFDGAEVTRFWYDEIKLYDFNNPTFSKETGHFTQVVWKKTEKLGVGLATGKEKSHYTLYVVAQYTPGGNVNGEFSGNVLSDQC